MQAKTWTVSEIKAANAAAGYFFFSPDTLRFFRSRIGDSVYQGVGGAFFVTSEQFVSSDGQRKPRRYTVRAFNPATGDCSTADGCEFNKLTRGAAIRLAQKMAQGKEG